VTRVRHARAADLLRPSGPRTQPLSGYEEDFVDIVDYIVRITHQIWTEGAIGRIYDTYDANCVVYSALGTIRSVEDVVANTLQSVAASGNDECHHLAVAWSGDDAQGFYTSHLGFGRATNIGPTIFGPATGRRTGQFFIADCVSRGNRIHTEWLIRDNGAAIRQMGLDAHDVARRIAATPAIETAAVTPPPRLDGSAPPEPYEGPTDTPYGWVAHHFDLWNTRRFDHFPMHYAPGAIAHWCGGRTAQGLRNVTSLVLKLLAGLPTSTVRVEHVSWAEETDGVILAVRWTLEGWSQPGGLLGDVPIGRPVSIMGATHFRFRGGWIVEEWTVFDEIGALVQIYRC
jgi:hypothetical protein